MNEDLKKKWDESERTGKPVPVGDLVVCDVCDADYTERRDSGGFIFGSYAYCPACAARHEPMIKSYNEEHMITARCPAPKLTERGVEIVSFADFVRGYRGPDATVYVRLMR